MKGGAALPRNRSRPSAPRASGEGSGREAGEPREPLEYVTTEIGGIESLFTPEGIERLNALREAEPKRLRRKRSG